MCYVLWLQKNIILCYINIFLFQLVIRTKSGELVDRLSPWAKFVTQPDDTKAYDQVFWSPPQVERWGGGHSKKKNSLENKHLCDYLYGPCLQNLQP